MAQDMDKVIVGPPGYGSPEEKTNAARLVTLDEHALKDEIDADYGADVKPEDVEAATPDHVVEQLAQNKKASKKAGSESDDEGYDSYTKEELVDMARDREIEGFSTMNKAELVKALEKSDEG